jgi:hypothetical protein
MAASGKERLRSRRRSGATITLAALVLGLLIAVSSSGSHADAAAYGQIGEPWGSVGTGKGQFTEPTVFGVDPVDGSTYVGDTVSGAGTASPLYRLQRFSSQGTLEASAELSGLLEPGVKVSFRGAAVDHENGLVYLLEQCTVGNSATSACQGSGTPFALALRVFKTAPSGGQLVPAATPRILLPTSTEDQIRKPTSIAVDPVTHGIVVLGQSFSEHRIFERISPAGSLEARFEDTANKTKIGAAVASSVVVGPTGVTYTLTGNRNSPGASATRLWELPPSFSAISPVPGFAAAAEAEGWVGGAITSTSRYAPEVALSPDGKSVYWKEGIVGEVTVRDFSLTKNSTTSVLGGGTGRCRITSPEAGLGVWGEGSTERILVLDPGEVTKPRNQVVTFGQGGTGCPTPVARFKINGSEADGTVVQANQRVEFNASSSELIDGEVESVTWYFGDGSEPKVLECERLKVDGPCEQPASLKTTHEYETNGSYTVTVEIRLTHSSFGSPAPESHTLVVEGGAAAPPAPISVLKSGTGSGTVTSSPGGIECGSKCSALFAAEEGVVLTATPAAGSKFAGWTEGSCSGTGTCSLTGGGEQTVTARFESEGPPPSDFEMSASVSGPGTVTSVPAGILCGTECIHRFASGATVTLTAAPTGGARFIGWTGACKGNTLTCEVEMDETRSVHAAFEAVAAGQVLVVSVGGSGAGAVKSAKAGIFCGLVCESSFKKGTVVTLFPEALPGSEFIAWAGDCAGSGLTCELKMSAERHASASFAAKPVVIVTPPATAPAAAAAPPPASTPPAATKTKAKKKKKAAKKSKTSSKAVKKKLAKCRKLKPAAKAKCVRKAHGKPHHKRHS